MRERRGAGLLDTSTVILLPRIGRAEQLPIEPAISTITLAELSVGPLVASSDVERASRQAHLQQAESDFEPIPFDSRAARAFGRVAADLRAAGRKGRARAYDALIAAVSIGNALPLFTVNPDDFQGISALDLEPVDHPDALG